MTRQLILMRHAKSSWSDLHLDDHERPLNGRGEDNAKALGQWMSDQDLKPEVILCSTARRTQETVEHLGLPLEPILLKALYHASEDGMMELIATQTASSIMVVGHNPGIGGLANLLARSKPDHSRFQDYPTGATTVLEFDLENWAQIKPAGGTVQSFVIPKQISI